ncbi:protein phosphatase [Salipiger pallidus]|uniref:Protein phosphatase n=1 Tax=Salipiger pallidus TaxID=1775170 RepID=A0A8J3EFL3_9RHOB|nr:dual specificity protein phosphatase [Salipiger pallidus]GGG66470.1 protein phosphatase [Salipiger pallidus]
MHFLPDQSPEAERLEDDRPLLFPVQGTETAGFTGLWLGNLTAAEDGEALQEAGISASLNLAMNIFPGPLQRPDGTWVRRYQIGMIDGPGNAPQTLAAAVMLLDGLALTFTEGKPHYPPSTKGGLLVHCRGGRSRSVTVLALWLYWRQPERYPTFEAALDAMRTLRRQDDSYPLPPMLDLASDVLGTGLLR